MPARLILDTHVFLWWRIDSARLTAEARTAIATADVVFVSAASAWEAAIKAALGKLRLDDSFEKGVESSGFEKLPIQFAHAEGAGALPPHHRDPFDRMIIAQALIEDLTIVTHDRRLESYEARFLWL
jgi:PIN domain nuclease of toxin-antitoxin system